MLGAILNFLDLLLAALLAGSMFGVSLMLRPTGLDAGTYIILQQSGVRGCNNVLPMLGALTIAVTMAAAFASRDDSTRVLLLLAAGAGLLAAGLITRFLNQPINATIMTWAAAAPPADWTEPRDLWWRWHLVRLGLSLTALSLIIAAALRRG